MHQDLPQRILLRAYELDATHLDRVAARHGVTDWPTLTRDLNFEGIDTGGGCMVLVAQTQAGPWIGLTDGEADVPTTIENFCITVEPELFEGEEYVLFVTANEVTSHVGELLRD